MWKYREVWSLPVRIGRPAWHFPAFIDASLMKERKSQHVPPAHKTRVAGVESETQTRASSRRNDFYTVSGGYSGEVTPDPISNSEVKLASANGTARETLWESRTPPDFFWKPPTAMSGVSSFCVFNHRPRQVIEQSWFFGPQGPNAIMKWSNGPDHSGLWRCTQAVN